MSFELTIQADNAAFDDEPGREIARLLHHAAELVAEGWQSGPLVDINGNTVGRFGVR